MDASLPPLSQATELDTFGSDFPLMLEALGEGLDDIFNSGLDLHFGGSQSAFQGSPSGHASMPHGQASAGPVLLRQISDAGASERRPSESTAASGSSSGGQAQVDSLLQLQRQLQTLQASITSQLQQLQQQQEQQELAAQQPQPNLHPAASSQNPPPAQAQAAAQQPSLDVQDMQRMLVHMQSLLEQSQAQQQSLGHMQGLGIANSNGVQALAQQQLPQLSAPTPQSAPALTPLPEISPTPAPLPHAALPTPTFQQQHQQKQQCLQPMHMLPPPNIHPAASLLAEQAASMSHHSLSTLPPPQPPSAALLPAPQLPHFQQQAAPTLVSVPSSTSTGRQGREGKRSKPRGRPLLDLERQLEAKQAEAEALVKKNLELKRRQRMLGHFIRVREIQMSRLQAIKAQSLPAITKSATSNPSAVMRGITLEHMRNMDIAMSDTLFAESVQEVSRLLGLATGQTYLPTLLMGGPDGKVVNMGTAPNPADVAKELESVIKGMLEVSYIMMVMHPSFAKIRYANGVGGAGSAPPDHWQQVVEACSLDEEQALDMLMLQEIHSSLTGKVYEQRQQLVNQLQQLMLRGLLDTEGRSKSQVLTDKLHRSLQQERCLLFLTSEVFTQLITIEQIARITVASYPYKPDELAIIQAVSRMSRQPAGAGGSSGSLPSQWRHPMPVVTTA